MSGNVPDTLTYPLFPFYPNVKYHFSRVRIPPNRTPVSSRHYKLVLRAWRTVRVACKERHLKDVGEQRESVQEQTLNHNLIRFSVV